MRKESASMRPGVRQYRRFANRYVGPTISKVGGAGWAMPLSILFWLILYQYLPGSLDGFSGHSGEPVSDAANIGDRIVKVCMIVISASYIGSQWTLTRALSKHINPGTAAFLLLAILSALWSIEPSATVMRFISMATICLVCFATSLAGWHYRRFQQLSIPPLMFILVGSLMVGLIYPDRITEIGEDLSQKNAWHGITHGKNEFGMMASIGAIVCINRWLAREGRAIWAMAGAAAALLCLVLSRSNTSQLATVVGVFFMVLVMRVPVIKRRYSTHVVIGIAATILLYELVIQDVIPGVNVLLSPITALTGKDTTFSARTIIWNIVKEHIQAAPYLGTGYGAYWIGPFERSPSYVFTWLMNFYPTESHNGYLEVVNDLGLVGLGCLLAFLYYYIRQSLQLMRFDRSQAALYLALLFQQMVINMSESDWFSRTNSCTLFVLATTCLSRGLFEHRLHGQLPGLARR
jgi:O-antigen ligase